MTEGKKRIGEGTIDKTTKMLLAPLICTRVSQA